MILQLGGLPCLLHVPGIGLLGGRLVFYSPIREAVSAGLFSIVACVSSVLVIALVVLQTMALPILGGGQQTVV